MSWEEPTQEEYDDAVIEDTTHCDLCGCSILCGDNDCLIEDGESVGPEPFCLCMTCAKAVHDNYRKACEEMGEEP